MKQLSHKCDNKLFGPIKWTFKIQKMNSEILSIYNYG